MQSPSRCGHCYRASLRPADEGWWTHDASAAPVRPVPAARHADVAVVDGGGRAGQYRGGGGLSDVVRDAAPAGGGASADGAVGRRRPDADGDRVRLAARRTWVVSGPA